MSIENKMILGFLFIVSLCCAGAVSAADFNNTINLGTDVDSNEFISVSEDEQVDDVDESVLSAPNENNNFSGAADDEILSVSDEDFLSVTSQETDQYLNDIKTSTSDEFFKFVNYLVKEKGFKFNAKTSDEGYTIYSNSQYSCKLYEGENYVLPAGNTYIISKNRIGYVIDEYYPDILYSQNGNTYVDELYLGWLKWVENYHFILTIEDEDTIYVNTDNSISGGLNIVMNGAAADNANSITYSPVNSSNLPKAYDLRNFGGQNYVTPVKDQANAGTCWIFATMAALESHLLKTEGKTYDFSTNYDFSENNLKNVMSNIGRQGINRTIMDGGNSNFALSYLLRWSGPILDEFDKYDVDNNGYPANNLPIEFNNSAKHIQGVKYIHKRANATDNDEIKRAIMNYGGVVTSMWWIRDFNNYEIGDNYFYLSYWSNIGSISTGSYSNIGTVSLSDWAKIGSISTGSYSKIGSVSVSGWSSINSISLGSRASMGSVSVSDWGKIA